MMKDQCNEWGGIMILKALVVWHVVFLLLLGAVYILADKEAVKIELDLLTSN